MVQVGQVVQSLWNTKVRAGFRAHHLLAPRWFAARWFASASTAASPSIWKPATPCLLRRHRAQLLCVLMNGYDNAQPHSGRSRQVPPGRAARGGLLAFVGVFRADLGFQLTAQPLGQPLVPDAIRTALLR